MHRSRPDLEAMYHRLPVPLQHAACSFVGWRTNRTRYNADFDRQLDHAERRARWSQDQLESFRDARIADAVQHAYRTAPYYRALLDSRGIDPGSVNGLEALHRLPVLTKEEVRAHLTDIVSNQHPRHTTIVHTSGTTGSGLRFPVTRAAVQEQWAIWWRFRHWHGLSRGTWCALFAGRSVVPISTSAPPYWRYNVAGRQILFSGYHLAPDSAAFYLRELRRRRPPWLHGYPSILALLAGHILETRFDLGYAPRWVTTGAENLLSHQADTIERALGVAPVQHYGLTEGVANVSQCEKGSLHVDEDFAAVEFVATGVPAVHRIVGTGLANRATPLIRYDTGDLASLGDGRCLCGRPGRVVVRIDGRQEDYVVLSNGARIGRMDHVFKDMVHVREAQIHQARPGELTVRVVRGSGYGEEDERRLRTEFRKRVGDDTRIEVEYRAELPRTSTGKLRLVVSEVPLSSIDTAA